MCYFIHSKIFESILLAKILDKTVKFLAFVSHWEW